MNVLLATACTSMCRIKHGPAPSAHCSPRKHIAIHHLHMRKAGGTSVRENIRAACDGNGQFDSFKETEWGAYNWTQSAAHVARRTRSAGSAAQSPPPPDSALITSLRPPLDRLLSSYLFEGGVPEQCWAYAHEYEGDIDLTGDAPSPHWSAMNWTFIQRCFANHAHLEPFDAFMSRHHPHTYGAFEELGYRKYYGPNYYLRKVLAGAKGNNPCGDIDAAPQNWTCMVEFATRLMLESFEVIVLHHSGGPLVLRNARRHGAVPCCLDGVDWTNLTKFSAEVPHRRLSPHRPSLSPPCAPLSSHRGLRRCQGNIHRAGWIDKRLSSISKLMEGQIPLVYPALWRELTLAHAPDQALYDALVAHASQAASCD
jgi:hypothetical protein